jgi:phytol kinase
MLQNNFIALVVTFILAVIWLRINDFAAHRGWISSDISRKLIHIGTGPLFVLCWLLFDDSPSARFLAALIPLAITMQFLLVGLGVIRDEAAVKAMARSGDRREILRGPLFYGIVFVLLTIIYWKNSLIGITALMLLCGGDGLADIIGRRFGRLALPWNSQKTWAGSMGMILGGWLFAALIPVAYLAAGEISGVFSAFLPALTIIALAGAAVESLPTGDYDNLTVPLAALLLGHLLLPTV